MNPGIFVLAGGGDSGGSGGGKGRGGKNKQGAKGKNGGKDAGGGGKGACGVDAAGGNGGSCPNHHKGKGKKAKKSGKAAKGDPVDVVTGQVFTLPAVDVNLPGPLPLQIVRTYRSAFHDRDIGLGLGVSHSLAWRVEVGRRGVTVWNEEGLGLDFGKVEEGAGVRGPEGMLLVRSDQGFVLDSGEDRWLLFEKQIEDAWVLTRIVDEHGNAITLHYEKDALSWVEDSAGRVVRVARNRAGRIEAWEIKNAPDQGRWLALASFFYDERGCLVEARDAEGGATTFVYDEDGFLLSHTSPVGLTFHFRYDDQKRCVETWGAMERGPDISLSARAPAVLADGTTKAKGIYHCAFVYGEDGYSEAIDSVTVHRYFGNEHGKLDKAVVAGGVFDRTYDEHGHLTSFTDARGATTTWERDALGRVLRETDPLGRTTTHERDADGHIRSSIDPAGGETRVERRKGALAWVDPIGASFEIRFDHRGLTTETYAPNGGVTRYAHDEQGNRIEKIDALGHVTRWTYDAWGRCTAVQEEGGVATYYSYNTRGDVLAVRKTDGSVVRYAYDANGDRVSAMDETGRITRYERGGYRLLCATHEPDGAVTRMKYDREGRLVEVVNPKGEVHTIELSTAGMVIAETTFDGRTLRYEYDEMGQLAVAENGLGQKTEYVYDAAGQIVEQIYDGERVERFEYDALGELVRAEGPDGVVAYTRNAVGWVTREEQSVRGETVTLDTEHDLLGKVVRRTTSVGHSEVWQRDRMGQPQRVLFDGRHEVQPAFDALGREVARLLPRGGRIEAAYDARDRLVSRRVSKGEPAQASGGPAWLTPPHSQITAEQGYRYSPASELLETFDRAFGARSYEHDGAGRLVAAIANEKDAERFAYDENGNLHERYGVERRYGTGDRLLQRGATRYEWDGDARLVAARETTSGGEQAWTYTWGPGGLLERAEQSGGLRVEFRYDPFARRLEKLVSRVAPDGSARLAARTRYVWDGDALVHEIRSVAGAEGDPVVEERTYCYDERGAPWAHKEARTIAGERAESDYFHYLTDDIGTPEKLVAADGSIACEIRRSAWGEPTASPNAATSTPWGFPGQYYDEETGLFYNRYRYYDPVAGRYISADPVGLISGFNAFAYAENRPTRFVDPLGLMATATIENIPDEPGESDDYKQKKDKGYKGYSDAQPRPPDDKTKGTVDPAIQDAVDNAKKKFKTDDKDKSSKEKLPNTAGKCAEIEALSKQAKDIRQEMAKDKNWKKLSKDEQNARIRNKLRQQFQNGAKIKARDERGNGIPPCKFCAQVFRELGIHPDNIDADPNKDKKPEGTESPTAEGGVFVPEKNKKGKETDKPWDGKQVHGPGSPKTDTSETAVVPRENDTGGHQQEYNPKTGKKEGVYYPPENPPSGGYPPGGPKGKTPPNSGGS